MPNSTTQPTDHADLKAALLKRFRTHPDLAAFVRPISDEFADSILTRTVLLREFVDELILELEDRGTLDQLREALRGIA